METKIGENMEIQERKIGHGEIFFSPNDKILSFAIDDNTIYFYCLTSDKKSDMPLNKYIVLDNGDEVEENWHHVATLVEATKAKHIFLEHIPLKDNQLKEVTKIITDEGTETLEKIIDKKQE